MDLQKKAEAFDCKVALELVHDRRFLKRQWRNRFGDEWQAIYTMLDKETQGV
jgi:hypothetical protein